MRRAGGLGWALCLLSAVTQSDQGMSQADISFPWSLRREYENLKEARKASGELADKLKKDLLSSRSKVT